MKILIIFAHPSEKSYCSAIRDSLLRGLKEKSNEVRVHDLYQLNFDPILTENEHYYGLDKSNDKMGLQEKQQDIKWAEIICLIYPVYWYGPPAILKGYFDRILTKGFAYEYEVDHPIPLLINKKVL